MTDIEDSEPPIVALDVAYYRRPAECIIRILRENAGDCARCGKQLARVLCCWDHPVSVQLWPSRPWQLGDDSFPVHRHADGSKPCWTQSDDIPKPKCGTCGSVDQLDVRQEPYGDRVTCRVCGANEWHDIGD